MAMNGFGGFEFDGSAELKARAEQQIAALRQSNDINSQLAANSQQVIGALFGSPEIRKAQRTERALEDSLAQVGEKQEGESEFDYQVRQQEAVRSNLSKVDPKVALQANDNLIKLKTEQLEQRKMKASTTKMETDTNEAVRVAELAKKTAIFQINKDGTRVPVKWVADGEDPIAALNAYNQAHAGTFDLGTGIEMTELEEAIRGGGLSNMNNSTIRVIQEGITNAKGFAHGLTSALKPLVEGRSILSLSRRVAEGSTAAENIATTFKALANEYTGVTDVLDPRYTGDVEAEKAAAEAKLSKVDPIIDSLVDQGVVSSVLKGQVKALAYQLAKSFEPGGRLSDQDVDMAMEMLVGDGNPETIRRLFEDRLALTNKSIQINLDYAMNNELGRNDNQTAISRREAERYFEARDEAYEWIDKLGARIMEEREADRLLGTGTSLTQHSPDRPNAEPGSEFESTSGTAAIDEQREALRKRFARKG
jgi:hypothetical protein